jgi:hypothetical protein
MNSNVMHSKVQMEPAILERLIKEVKETVATGVAVRRTNKPSLNLHLWAMRRNARYASTARRKPGIITGLGY